ncbi:MAG: hypothetical protein JWP42_858 [Pseudomonas sp.]|nr:hypothetical protein [Pseudomonas sp.]
MWACSRRRCVRQEWCWMCWPFRGQARSHRVRCCSRNGENTEVHCGSELAREGGVSGKNDIGCAGPFAGKPVPTGSNVVCTIVKTPSLLWERACSRRRCVRQERCWMCWPLRGQARSHRVRCCLHHCENTEVHCGSELAREGGVPGKNDVGCAGLFAGKPAPTGFDVVCTIVKTSNSLWERACSRRRCAGQDWCWMCWPLRGQARSHRVRCCLHHCENTGFTVGLAREWICAATLIYRLLTLLHLHRHPHRPLSSPIP